MKFSPMSRVENSYLTRSIIVGSRSRKLESQDFSHEWYCYVKPAFSSLNFIQSVTFKLHETFENPVIVKEYPFEIKEYGWGEFTIQLKITFVDPLERVVNLNHYLVLHEGEEKDGFIVSERYEEIVFRSPTVLMHRILGSEKDIKNEDFLKIEKEEGELIEDAILEMLNRFKEENL